MDAVILADVEQPLAGALYLLDGVIEMVEVVTEQPDMVRTFKFDDPIYPLPFQVDVGNNQTFPAIYGPGQRYLQQTQCSGTLPNQPARHPAIFSSGSVAG